MVSGEDVHNKSLIFLGHLRGKGVLGRDQSFNTARFWCLIYISYIYIYIILIFMIIILIFIIIYCNIQPYRPAELMLVVLSSSL